MRYVRLSLRLALLAACATSASLALGQTYQPPVTGTPQFASLTSGPDVINLGNLNVHFEIPLYHKDGRGIPFDYKLVYDSSIWSGVASQGSGNWFPANLGGMVEFPDKRLGKPERHIRLKPEFL